MAFWRVQLTKTASPSPRHSQHVMPQHLTLKDTTGPASSHITAQGPRLKMNADASAPALVGYVGTAASSPKLWHPKLGHWHGQPPSRGDLQSRCSLMSSLNDYSLRVYEFQI